MSNIADTRKVAKNTLLLYVRMFVLTIIGLFTSRVVLQALGVENYGINNVVAGFLSMFGIFTSSMSGAIGRFITVELGKGDKVRLKNVFTTALAVQLCIGLLIVVIFETFGIWFVFNELQIPEGRETAAICCFQCATLSTFIGLMSVPFMSAVVAHERMSAFAYMTILDATLKLVICYLLYVSPIDKLITFSILGVCVTVISTTIYWTYCFKHFEEAVFKFKFERILFKEIWGFAGWNTFAQTAWILNTQGVNMLMNIFFGVVVNAARGIAVQVNGIINQFVSNFMIALNPQITKTYAAGEKETSFRLACSGSRLSFYIMFILALPIMLESHMILELWLGIPPKETESFLIWTILSTFTTLLGNTLVTLQMAHGNIKRYQIYITIFGCAPFPLTWIIFNMGASAISAYYIYTFVYWILIFVRFYLVNGMTGIPAKMYLWGVVARTHVVGLLSAFFPLMVVLILEESLFRLFLTVLISLLSSCTIIYFMGLETSERLFVNKMVVSKITRLKK